MFDRFVSNNWLVEFNNRELAMFIWMGIGLAWALWQPEIRSAIGGVAQALLKLAILTPLLAFGAYIAGWVWIADDLGFWQPDLSNETVYWFLLSGLVLFGGFDRVYEQDDFFLKTTRRVLTLGILAELIINLVVMPLWIEFFLFPVIVFVGAMEAFVEGQEEYAPAKKLVEGVATLIGFALLIFVSLSLLNDPNQFDVAHGLRLLALPVWLALASLPFIYALGLYAAYDRAFRRMSFVASDSAAARRAKLVMVRRLHLRARRVGAFDGSWQRRLLDAMSADQATEVVSDFLRTQRQPGRETAPAKAS